MKKFLSIFLSFIIIICAIPLGAFTFNVNAAIDTNKTYTEGAYTYKITISYYTDELYSAVITDVDPNSVSGSITLPSKLGGYKVEKIGDYALMGCSNVTEVNIDNYVAIIGKNVFSDCSNLTSVRIGSNVVSIDDYTFSRANNLMRINVNWLNDKYSSIEGVLFDKDQTKILKYPCSKTSDTYYISNTVTSIKDNAFADCVNLKKIIIPGTLTNVNNNAFSNCTSLTSVQISNGVTSIGSKAFYNCTGLTSVSMPYSLTSIGDNAFSGCNELATVIIPDSVTSIGQGAFKDCNKIKSITLPFVGATKDGTSNTHFGYIFAKYNRNLPTSLTNVTITSACQSIDANAFKDCGNITNVNIAAANIKENAFYGCTSLKNVTLNNGVEKIGEKAFENCSSLECVTMSKNVKRIDADVFYNCNTLKNIYFKGIWPEKANIDIDESNTQLQSATWHYTNTTDVLNYQFSNDDSDDLTASVIGCAPFATVVNIPETISRNGKTYTVTSIGGGAFADCTNLTSITIPDSVTNIGGSAFVNCTGLSSITLPDSVTSIGYGAFSDCINLTSIAIPNSITDIDGFTFSNCTSLTSITIPDGVTSISLCAFSNCTNLTSIAIPNSVVNISNHAFSNCTSLTSVIVPNSVEYIGHGVFEGCNSIIDITLPFVGCSRDKSNSGYENVFGIIFDYTLDEDSQYEASTTLQYTEERAYNTYYKYYYYIPLSLKTVTITDDTQISNKAFFNCKNLLSISIPGSVQSIGSSAFYNCSGLTSVYFGGTQTQWSNFNNKPACNNVVYYNKIGLQITPPTKTEYVQGDTLDLSGGTVAILYNGNITDKFTNLSNSSVKINFDNQKIGEQEVTVKYYGESSTFTVNVVEKPENTTEFAGGKGIEGSPYLVSTKEHLNNVRKYPNAYFKQINDIEFSKEDFVQGGDYYNSGYCWMPIGKDKDFAFSGMYDGGGYSIKNLKVNITTANSASGGLFGYCTGDLKNITIKNGDIKVVADGDSYAGGIVGYHTDGVIDNCHNINTTVDAIYAGGIVAYSYYTDYIKNCSNSGTVDGTYMGGIVGCAHTVSIYGAITSDNIMISNCTNSGNLIKKEKSGSYIGGIVGWHDYGTLIIRECTNTGEIYAEGTYLSSITLGGCPCVGGIIGFASNADISSCENTGDIYGDMAGGIGGYGIFTIRYSTNAGRISGRNSVGGIIGFHYEGAIYSSVNKGDILGIRYSEGKVVQDHSGTAGGIIGDTDNGSGIYYCRNTGNVKNGFYSGGIAGIATYSCECYNTGNITGVEYAGGIFAEFNTPSAKIWDCFNIGNITAKYAAGILCNLKNNSTVDTCYSAGKIKSTDTSGYIGGIVAFQTAGNIADCYYLDNVSQGVGYFDYSLNTSPITTKLNAQQFEDAGSFKNFDFSSVWTMGGNEDYKYPELVDVEMEFTPYLTGDINDDGKINGRDYAVLIQYLNDWDVVIVKEAADINGDGKINGRDYAVLIQYLNDWDVQLG